jgi:hypothetical protein
MPRFVAARAIWKHCQKKTSAYRSAYQQPVPPRPFYQQRKDESGNSLTTVERALPLLLFFPRKRPTLEIKRDLLQAECGRPEQSIKLAALVFLVLHDEGALLPEIRFSKLCSR